MFEEADVLDTIVRTCSDNDWLGGPDRGEWWIDENGTSNFADGDVGDYNHDMLASNEIYNRLGFDYSENGPYSREDANGMFSNYLPDAHLMDEDLANYAKSVEETHGEGWEHEAELRDYLIWKNTKDIIDPEKKAEKVKYYNEMYDALEKQRGPSDYAIKNFGWHRLENHSAAHLETFQLTPQTLQSIQRGLWDTFGEYVQNMHFTIEVHQPRKTLMHVPFSEIQNGLVLNRMKEREPDQVPDVRPGIPRQAPPPMYKYPGG